MSVSQHSRPLEATTGSTDLAAGVAVLSTAGQVIECNATAAALLASDADNLLLRTLGRADALTAARAGLAWATQVEVGRQWWNVRLLAEQPGRLLAVMTQADAPREPVDGEAWIDEAPAMVAFVDPAGRIIAANRGLRGRLALHLDQMVGREITDFVRESDRPKLSAHLRAVNDGVDGAPAHAFDVRLSGGESIDVACALSSMRDGEGGCLGAWVVLQDIGDRVQVERDLEAYTHDLEQLYLQLERRTDELQAANEALREARLKTLHAEELARIEQMKSAFLDVAAHELRTPVTLLTGLLDCLAQDMPQALRDNLLTAAQRSAARLVTILNTALKLLESGQPEFTGQFRPRSLRRLLEDAAGDVRSFSQMRNHRLVVDVSDSLPPVTMDVSMMRDVVANLLMNAIKFTPDGGQVTLTAGLCDDGEHCWFAVRDNGIGIPEADRPFIFDQFFGTLNTAHHSSGQYEFNSRGPGFGLAVVRKFVDVHRGRIDLVSSPGSGSCFTVTLPIRRKSAAS